MKIVKKGNITILFSMLLNIVLNSNPVMAQPIRDPSTKGYVTARELPDNTVPSLDSLASVGANANNKGSASYHAFVEAWSL